jgi:hypothetical protein
MLDRERILITEPSKGAQTELDWNRAFAESNGFFFMWARNVPQVDMDEMSGKPLYRQDRIIPFGHVAAGVDGRADNIVVRSIELREHLLR